MKATRGKANPKMVREIVQWKLSAVNDEPSASKVGASAA
jgi:hypothetical protein